MVDQALPIFTVLPELLDALSQHNSAVLIAPPGAGKTTSVAPALLDQPWCTGQIILLSPRRVAARAAAERIADLLGEPVGQRVGYITRLDSKQSAATRILVVTEAIFVNRLLDDQELSGVSAVLFDEAHERHLDSDLGLALALEAQAVLREDLRLVVMSATIDGARFATLLGPKAPTIESEGRAFPLRIEWLGRKAEQRIEDAMASAILTAWRDEAGDILAFLPGVGEIERVRERLCERLPAVPILPLHGQVDPAAQRNAIRRDAEGRRRIVLATTIAETSITLDGVSVVVDCGLSRRAEFDLAAGVTHLVTTRASQASAAQRAGRAARQSAGVAYRLWEEASHAGRERFDPPEILTSDLAPLALSLARWGVADPAAMAWIDAPPAAAMVTAQKRLQSLGALDADKQITPRGHAMAQLPMAPWQAAMVLYGARHNAAGLAAKIALLVQERGLGGRSEDLAQRLSRWEGDRSPRASSARKLAEGWARKAEKLHRTLQGDADHAGQGAPVFAAIPPAIMLAMALPDNLARRRDASGETWISAGGRGYALDPASPLGSAQWLVIGDAQGKARAARITAGFALDMADVERWLTPIIERRQVLKWTGERVDARLEQRIGAITLSTGSDPSPDMDAVADILVDKAVERLGIILPSELIARAGYAGIAPLSLEVLAEEAADWLRPLLHGKRDLAISRSNLMDALYNRLSWDERQALDKSAPKEFVSPAGTHHAVDYAGDDAPSVELRVQALFGLDHHPMIGRTPLLLRLTSPGGKPVQSTRDLPGFWRGSWADVCKDMKGRYPKHRWPERPWEEKPSLKTKNAFERS